jgi:glycosyltransferase involved in cell wall biosynthesis
VVASITWAVVPCHNEARVVGPVLESLTSAFDRVVCVDDASVDNSAAVAAGVRGVALVRHPVNLGQGGALRTGLEYALQDPAASFFVTFDADGQHRVSDALTLVEMLGRPGPDGRPLEIVLGTRFGGDGAARGAGRSRRLLLRAATAFTRLQTGLAVTDTHNGLRAFTRPVAESLDLSQRGMAHASEILVQIARRGWSWAECGVEVDYTSYAKAKGQSGLGAVNILADLLMSPRR